MTALTQEPTRFARLRDGEAPVIYREATVDHVERIEGNDGTEQRVVTLSFSSEHPVMRVPWWSDPYLEILGHDEGEVDLYRAKNGASVFYNHISYDPAMRLGAILDAWIEKGRGYARIQISNRDEVEGFWTDIRDGLLKLVSVGYVVHEAVQTKASDTEIDEFRVTSWEPVEISMVGVPADPTVGVNRGDGPLDRSDPEAIQVARSLRDFMRVKSGVTTVPEPVTDPNPKPADDAQRAAEQAARDAQAKADRDAHDARIREEARQQALTDERARQGEIRTMLTPHRERDGMAELETRLLGDPDIDVEAARKEVLDALGKRSEPLGDGNGHVEVVADSRDKNRDGMRLAIFARCNLPFEGKPVVLDGNEFRSYSLLEMSRACVRNAGLSMIAADPMDMVARSFHSTSDFPLILADSSRVSLSMGYEEADETFEQWTRAGNLSDFKIHKRVALSSYSNLVEIPEGGTYKYGTFEEEGEQISLGTYGSMFAITRQMIINDDLDAFSTVPRRQGRAAKRTVGDLVYTHVGSNPVLGDGVATFDAAHNNEAPDNGVPNIARLVEAEELMGSQVDANNNAVNINPAFVIVQPSDYRKTLQLMKSEFDPDSPATPISNMARDMAEVVKDHRMKQYGGEWWMAGSPSQYDTVEVAYLYGNKEPALDEKEGWSRDGVEYKVRLDVGVKVVGWRAMVKNPG